MNRTECTGVPYMDIVHGLRLYSMKTISLQLNELIIPLHCAAQFVSMKRRQEF